MRVLGDGVGLSRLWIVDAEHRQRHPYPGRKRITMGLRVKAVLEFFAILEKVGIMLAPEVSSFKFHYWPLGRESASGSAIPAVQGPQR